MSAAIALVISARRRDLGGFEVGRVLPWPQRRMVGPFIFFDHMGPVNFPAKLARATDVRPHPHIGLSTITYLFAGEIVHRDSVGCYQVIRPGEVNWMTAGRGISHSERFETMREHGGRLEGIQAWIALPLADEDTAPSFVHIDATALPSGEIGGATVKLIAGAAFGMSSPVHVHSPLFYLHVELPAGVTIDLPEDYSERAIYVVNGAVSVQGSVYESGQMIVFAMGGTASVTANSGATLMLLGGEPVGERHIWWNFVASTKDRIEQAKADWREGRIPLPVDDTLEFIPLPTDPPPPPEPMS
jgi:redox-sensitive bicupin YhaK (pirin superfamily)